MKTKIKVVIMILAVLGLCGIGYVIYNLLYWFADFLDALAVERILGLSLGF